MTKSTLRFLLLFAALSGLGACGQSSQQAAAEVASGGTASCPSGGLDLPAGFCATVFADKLEHVRHLVVDARGLVYANSAPDLEDDAAPSGLIVLQDKDGDGKADRIERPYPTQPGGTGIALWQNKLFVETHGSILRYALNAGDGRPEGAAQTVVDGLPTTGDHPAHSIAVAADGSLFVNSGSATNACQAQNRQPGVPGAAPCTEKELRAGIWRYRADQTGQHFSAAARFATGIRNAMGLTLDTHGRIFATQHGRDQLHENWGRFYSATQGQELPAEELVEVVAGADYGWPECYFDPEQKRLVLAPEYGGDGGKTVGQCAQRRAPVAAFPAHWAPNALAVYEGSQFPAAYRGGAFIAFHGSWNRAPGPQQGFNVVFQPMRNGKASGPYVVFADGFAGSDKASGKALHRPTGLAVGPDGALYIADDEGGRIWRVTYRGKADAPLGAAPVPAADANAPAPAQAARPLPAGVDAAQIALGRRLYSGEIAGAPCAGCHGADGEGTPVGPDLVDSQWLWGKGELADIRRSIVEGVPHPKRFPSPMPPRGGATLTDPQVDAIAAYLWSASQGK
jgi:glucose/arabinose dehydrogenase/cytochrome c5